MIRKAAVRRRKKGIHLGLYGGDVGVERGDNLFAAFKVISPFIRCLCFWHKLRLIRLGAATATMAVVLLASGIARFWSLSCISPVLARSVRAIAESDGAVTCALGWPPE
jgi:hypothetical protein